MKKPLVIYHKGCMDGIASAWCFWKVYGNMFEYFPGTYDGLVPDFHDRDVHMVDFCYDKETVSQMLKVARKVEVIDHHKARLNEIQDLMSEENYHDFSMEWCSINRSGSMLCWRALNTMFLLFDMPEIFRYIDDRDRWVWQLRDTKEIMAAAFTWDLTIEGFNELVDVPIEKLKEMGKILLKARDKDVERLCRNVFSVQIGRYTVPAVNAPSMYASDVGNKLTVGNPFSVTYYRSGRNMFYSLRSDSEGIDVCEVAKQFGGGGHPHAAGFVTTIERSLIFG
jgi:uncharacterized protein